MATNSKVLRDYTQLAALTEVGTSVSERAIGLGVVYRHALHAAFGGYNRTAIVCQTAEPAVIRVRVIGSLL